MRSMSPAISTRCFWDRPMATPSTTSPVNAIAVADDGTVYAGGSFTNSGNTVIRHVARWDGVNWQPLGIGINDVVNALAVNGNILYAGGQFAYAGGFTANRLAKWDGANWSAFTGGVTVGNVYALRFDGQDLYV